MEYRGIELEHIMGGIYCIANHDDYYGWVKKDYSSQGMEEYFDLQNDYRDVKISINDISILHRSSYKHGVDVPNTYRIKFPVGEVKVSLIEVADVSCPPSEICRTLFIIPEMDLWWNFRTNRWETIGDTSITFIMDWNHIGCLDENPYCLIDNVRFNGGEMGSHVQLGIYNKGKRIPFEQIDSVDWSQGAQLLINGSGVSVCFFEDFCQERLDAVFCEKEDMLSFIETCVKYGFFKTDMTPVIIEGDNYPRNVHQQKIKEIKVVGVPSSPDVRIIFEDGSKRFIDSFFQQKIIIEGDLGDEPLRKITIRDGRIVLIGDSKEIIITAECRKKGTVCNLKKFDFR